MEIRVEARKSRAREDRARCDRRATRTDDSGEAVRMLARRPTKGSHPQREAHFCVTASRRDTLVLARVLLPRGLVHCLREERRGRDSHTPPTPPPPRHRHADRPPARGVVVRPPPARPRATELDGRPCEQLPSGYRHMSHTSQAWMYDADYDKANDETETLVT